MARKNRAAVTLGRKGGIKGGPARAAKLTALERRESARKAVMARWAKNNGERKAVVSKSKEGSRTPARSTDTSDNALHILLGRLKKAVDLDEIRQLSDQLERVIFHKQFTNA
jgi:hypothetical protein